MTSMASWTHSLESEFARLMPPTIRRVPSLMEKSKEPPVDAVQVRISQPTMGDRKASGLLQGHCMDIRQGDSFAV